MPTKRVPRRRNHKTTITITPEVVELYLIVVDTFRDDDREDEFNGAGSKLNEAFGFSDVIIEETFGRDAPPDWLSKWRISEWLKAHEIRLQLDQAANIK